MLVIHCMPQYELFILRYLASHHIPDRVTILLHLVTKSHPFYSVFPINHLRNLAIRNIRTTHFLILDMDLRVSRSLFLLFSHSLVNTYEEVMSLPQFLYRSNRSAVILPVFFNKNSQVLEHCSTIESCAYLWVFLEGGER